MTTCMTYSMTKKAKLTNSKRVKANPKPAEWSIYRKRDKPKWLSMRCTKRCGTRMQKPNYIRPIVLLK